MSARTETQKLMERLAHARIILAGLVVEDVIYMPFFKRIEQEIAALKDDLATLERARQLLAA